MALVAKGNTIAHLEPKFGKVGKGLDVMGAKIPATSVTTFLAAKVIAQEYIIAPSFVLLRKALVTTVSKLAIFVAMNSFATRNVRRLSKGFADTLTFGKGTWLSFFFTDKSAFATHAQSLSGREVFALHGAWLTLHVFTNKHMATRKTLSSKAALR